MLSSFPVDVPVFPVNYDNCHLMNARNDALCRRATGRPRGRFLRLTRRRGDAEKFLIRENDK